MGSRNSILCALTVAGLLAGCAALPDRPATADSVARQFETVAFASDYGRGSGMVTRWTRRPRVQVLAEPEVVAAHQADVAEAARVFAGLPAAPPAERPALTLAFVPRASFAETLAELAPGAVAPEPEALRRFAEESACMGSLFGVQGEIDGALVLIGADNPPDLRRRCIVEEVVQAAGLPADACEYAPSLFCESNHADRPTAADMVLLRALYDPRLAPGMPRAQAMPIAREVIRELMG